MPLPPLRCCVPLLVLALTACTTVDDFRRYTPERRAQLVCERQPEVASLAMRLGTVSRQHADTQAALDRGYHLHRQCHEVRPAVREVCETQGTRRVCTTREVGEPRLECREVPVPLVYSLETTKLAAYAQEMNSLSQSHAQAWERCFQHVRTLSAEAAFGLY